MFMKTRSANFSSASSRPSIRGEKYDRNNRSLAMMSYGGGNLSSYAEPQKKPRRNFDSRKRNPRTLKRIIQAFAPYRVQVIMIALAILLGSLLGLVPSILISYIFDDAISKGNMTLLLIYVAI